MSVIDLFRLDGQVAVITGGAQGLGLAMARALGDAGAHVVLADINEKLAAQAANELTSQISGRCLAVQTDVTDANQVDGLVTQVLEEFGGIDILVNNAGIVRNIASEDMVWNDWHKVLEVNLDAVFICSQRVGKEMIKRRFGQIINIASMSGLIVNHPQPQSSYNVSKAGVIMLTKSLAAEWASYGIRVNAIAPGYMETDMTKKSLQSEMATEHWIGRTPLGRAGQPEELGGAVIYLASPASSFTTGHTMVIDGGYTVW